MSSRAISRLQRFYENNWVELALWPNLLSLDAPLIAVLWQTLLARDLGVHLSRTEPLVLAACVWLVYNTDRVLDALRPPNRVWEPARKVFYRKHVRLAAASAVLGGLALLPVAYWLLARPTFLSGLALGVPVASYILIVHAAPSSWRTKWPRELVAACIFALGTFLAVWTAKDRDPRPLVIPVILFSALCFANIAAIEDLEEQEPSPLVGWIGRNLVPVGIVIAGGAALARFAGNAGICAAAALSGIILASLGQVRFRLSRDALRLAFDAALCTPALILALR